MNYDLRRTNPRDRKRFVNYANSLLRNERPNVSLLDESKRTPNQNSYMHVLCRILAVETGVSEDYAKQVYFKNFANKAIFHTVSKDPITGTMTPFIRHSSELTVPEMRKAIDNFLRWAADNGYNLPEASIKDDGSVEFSSDKDKEAYNQAIIETSKQEQYL